MMQDTSSLVRQDPVQCAGVLVHGVVVHTDFLDQCGTESVLSDFRSNKKLEKKGGDQI